MVKKILIHGSGHKAISWQETISYMKDQKNILCPDLYSILNGQDATYENLYTSFVEYCSRIDGQIHLVGLSLGGIIAMNYALDFPEKVKTLVVIGTPHKIPKVAFEIQNVIFRFFPKSVFKEMAFDKKDTFALGNSIKKLEIADRMQEIKCPVLVICGEKDRANKKSVYYFSENIENVALCMIEKTGHVVNEENPKELARILNEYYDGK
ncbi:alpha/beta fold hydrolase [Blautia stercoris]|uniref:Alpha/beta fold hydrolase n=1 Tax=Blautia stercoris TaxID=871664 RepID=A0ABR7PBS3_9FIRM|nr:alpha/beta fold hydrolase [Blautia stercoris]